MIRESLEKIKALVEKRQQQLKDSDNPKVFARQRLIEGGLFLESGEPNPIFDSRQYDGIKFGFTDLELPGEKAVATSQPLGGGYIFASIGENLEIVRESKRVFTRKTVSKKLPATTERQKIAHENK